jgi:hypothetical protein
MKRLWVASILLAALGSATVLAQQTPSTPGSDMSGGYNTSTVQGGGGMMQGGGGMGGGMMQPGWHGHGFMHGPGGGPCIGCMVACASMITPHMVATNDGGVVVAIGGRLIKYNANLRKVADIPIEIDWTQVQRRVEQIVQNCPMGRRMVVPPRGQYQQPAPGQYQGQPQSQFQGQQ